MTTEEKLAIACDGEDKPDMVAAAKENADCDYVNAGTALACVRCRTEAAALARMAHGRFAAMRYGVAFDKDMKFTLSNPTWDDCEQLREECETAYQAARALGVTHKNLMSAAGVS